MTNRTLNDFTLDYLKEVCNDTSGTDTYFYLKSEKFEGKGILLNLDVRPRDKEVKIFYKFGDEMRHFKTYRYDEKTLSVLYDQIKIDFCANLKEILLEYVNCYKGAIKQLEII